MEDIKRLRLAAPNHSPKDLEYFGPSTPPKQSYRPRVVSRLDRGAHHGGHHTSHSHQQHSSNKGGLLPTPKFNNNSGSGAQHLIQPPSSTHTIQPTATLGAHAFAAPPPVGVLFFCVFLIIIQ